MSALAPVDAASCRAMAAECGRRATYLAKRLFGAEALRELDRARELCLLALKFEQEENSLQPDPQLPVGSNGGPGIPSSEAGGAKMDENPLSPDRAAPPVNQHVNSERAATHSISEGPKSRPGDAAASLTQQSSSPRQERPSAQERSSDRSGGQFGDAPKPAHIQRASVGAA